MVHIQLDDFYLSGFIPGQVLQHGRRYAAWSAPFGPEVDQNRCGGLDFFAEADIGAGDDPGQRVPAFAADGNLIRGGYFQSVFGAALCADKYGFLHISP